MKTNTKIEFNDTPELRGFASEKFTWVLDKESGISCAWGKSAKENPTHDEIGPEILNWKISEFDLKTYIKYFNFLTNIQIKNEETNEVNFCEETSYTKLLKIKDNLICMSTFGNIIFNINFDLLINNFKDFEKFFNYIKLFNIKPKLVIEYYDGIYSNKDNIIDKNIKNLLKLTNNFILKINPEFFNYIEIADLLITFYNKNALTSLEIGINNDNYGQVRNLLENISEQISITLNFNFEPYISLEKYLKIQNLCKEHGLVNVVMTQCSKKHFSKRIIGTILHEIECPAARFSIYLNNNFVYPCEFNKYNKFDLNSCKSIHDFWSSQEFTLIKNNLISNGYCKIGENKK